MKNRITKWTWDKFGIADPDFDWHTEESMSTISVLIEDQDAILKLVSFPDTKRIEVQFYPTVGMAIVIVTGCVAALTMDQLRSINKSSQWDIMVLSETEFEDAKESALRKFKTIANVPSHLPKTLVEHGIFDFDDLSIADPQWLASLDGMTIEMADKLIENADQQAEL